MPIVVRLDRVMADRKIKLIDLANRIGITNVNLSKIKCGNIKAIRFTTLEAICHELKCQPGDLLEFVEEADPNDVRLEDTITVSGEKIQGSLG